MTTMTQQHPAGVGAGVAAGGVPDSVFPFSGLADWGPPRGQHVGLGWGGGGGRHFY